MISGVPAASEALAVPVLALDPFVVFRSPGTVFAQIESQRRWKPSSSRSPPSALPKWATARSSSCRCWPRITGMSGPILAGVLAATLATAAGRVGVWFGEFLRPALLDAVVGASMLGMALWTLKPDAPGERAQARPPGRVPVDIDRLSHRRDRRPDADATVARAAGYANLAPVVASTTIGVLAANTPRRRFHPRTAALTTGTLLRDGGLPRLAPSTGGDARRCRILSARRKHLPRC
jgi:hypothetical protein